MATNLGAIEDLGDQKVKIEQYKQSLLGIIERKYAAEITAFIDHSKDKPAGQERSLIMSHANMSVLVSQ